LDFNSFLIQVKSQIGKHDFSAQKLMSPFNIGDRNKWLATNPTPRLSAVMILIYNKNNHAHIALIERPKYEGVHSGQIALPGGSKDPEDSNLQVTALRELYEEVGITGNVTVLGKLSDVYIPPSKFLVTPFIGVLNAVPNFIKDDFEVEQIIETPISLLFNDDIIKNGNVHIGVDNTNFKAPYFNVFGHKVWGATAIILSEFKALMK
jgi:8-oxo-dGTP pyrophosphatase MutT (NUDIX family)